MLRSGIPEGDIGADRHPGTSIGGKPQAHRGQARQEDPGPGPSFRCGIHGRKISHEKWRAYPNSGSACGVPGEFRAFRGVGNTTIPALELLESAKRLAWGSDRSRFWTSFFLIALVNIYAHSPALEHPPRGDHWHFWINTRGGEGWWDHVRKYYAYERIMEVQGGDTVRFKPVESVYLLTLKCVFGADMTAWQVASLAVHLSSCLWLLLLLWRIRPGLLPFFFVLWFSTLHACQEMVVWHGIQGYSLLVSFILGSMYCLFRYTHDPAPKERFFTASWLLAALACFTVEMGMGYSALAAFYLMATLRRGRWWRGLLFLLPIVAFVIASSADMASRGLHHLKEDNPLIPSDLSLLARNVGILFRWAILNSVFPSQFHLSHKRMHMPIVDIDDIALDFDSRFWTLCVLALAGCFFWARRPLMGLGACRPLLPFMAVVVLTLLGNAVMLATGRMQPRGPDVIATNTHYCYFLMAFLTIPVFIWVQASPPRAGRPTIPAIPAWVFAIMATVLVDRNVHLSRNADQELKRVWRPSIRFWDEVHAFVDEHKNEPGFSIAISPHPLEDSIHFGLHSSTILFWRWLDGRAPKYLLEYKDRRLRAELRDPSRTDWVEPEYLGVDWGNRYNLYRWENDCYGVVLEECPFLPSWIPRYRYLVRGDSPEAVRGRIPAAFGRIQEDRAERRDPPNPPHFLWERGYLGFNIYRVGGMYWGKFYCLSEEEGEFDLAKAFRRLYRRCHSAHKMDDLKHWIDHVVPE